MKSRLDLYIDALKLLNLDFSGYEHYPYHLQIRLK
jgi:hypothetical protein